METKQYKSLKSLAAKPKLIPIHLDDISVTTFNDAGEPTTTVENYLFYTWDRQPLDMFMSIAAVVGEKNAAPDASIKLALKLVLDEEGKPFIEQGNELPSPVITAAVFKIYELLGN